MKQTFTHFAANVLHTYILQCFSSTPECFSSTLGT